MNDRNIRVVTITPNQPAYPTISGATVFTDIQVWASRYYTPSISSHSNNNLSLSWRNNSSILSAKRVSGSWQSVTSLGSGVDPSSSERLDNTQNTSVHFRRGTALPYSLAPSVISTGGGPMEKSTGEEIATSFASEGIEISAASAKGTSSFILVDAKTGGTKINFEDPKEERTGTSIAEIRTALKSKPFAVNGDLNLKLSFKNLGDLLPLLAVRVLLEEVNRIGATIRTLGIAKQYDGTGNTREQYTFEIPQTSNNVRILVDPVLRDDSMRVEINKWYVVNDTVRSLEKFAEETRSEKVLAPAVLDLLQNYPNPFNPATTIEFTVPKNGQAKLSVYNSLGQSVATLFDGFAESGYVQKATFNGSRFASGVYFSRLEFEGKTMMKKLMLVK